MLVAGCQKERELGLGEACLLALCTNQELLLVIFKREHGLWCNLRDAACDARCMRLFVHWPNLAVFVGADGDVVIMHTPIDEAIVTCMTMSSDRRP